MQEAVDSGLAAQQSRVGRALFAVYGNDLNIPDVNLTETGGSGIGLFLNVDPGEYFFDVASVDGLTCTPYFSGNLTEGRYPVIVEADQVISVTAVCR